MNPDLEGKMLKMMTEINEISKKIHSLDEQIVK